MARPLRLEYPGALYHVTARGNARQDIFLQDEDRPRFLRVLEQVVARCHLLLHAYCLMDNHFHLVVETPDANLSKAMRQLNGVYTQPSTADTNGWAMCSKAGSRRSSWTGTTISSNSAGTSSSTRCGLGSPENRTPISGPATERLRGWSHHRLVSRSTGCSLSLAASGQRRTGSIGHSWPRALGRTPPGGRCRAKCCSGANGSLSACCPASGTSGPSPRFPASNGLLAARRSTNYFQPGPGPIAPNAIRRSAGPTENMAIVCRRSGEPSACIIRRSAAS